MQPRVYAPRVGIFRRRDSDAFEQWREGSTAEPATPPTSEEIVAEPVVDEPTLDWATAPVDSVPPWRREDRALVEQARAAAAAAAPADEDSAALARDLRRLAAMSGDSALTDEEYVAAVRARLAQR